MSWMASMTQTIPPLADDLLTGASEIAAYLGWPERRVYYMTAKGYLPIKRIGSQLVARCSELDRALTFGNTPEAA